MFLKLFKLDRSAPAAETPAAEPSPEALTAPAQEPVSAATEAPLAEMPAPANDRDGQQSDTDVQAGSPADAEAVRAALSSFVTTENLEPLDEPLGQEAALKALRLGAGVKGQGFHVLAIAEPGLEPVKAALHVLEPIARLGEPASDWVYVSDFASPARRRAIRLPHGAAPRFSQVLAEAAGELKVALCGAFAAEDYKLRRRAVEEEAKAAQERRLDEFSMTAAAQNVALLRTPSGFALAPMHDGKVVKPDVFQRLPEGMRRDVEARVAVLQAELSELLSSAPLLDRETRRRLALLDEEVAAYVVHPIVADAAARLSGIPAADDFLSALAQDVVRNATAIVAAPVANAEREVAGLSQMQRYLACLAVTAESDKKAAPVVVEIEASPERLLGSATACRDGAACLSIKPGALHAANNGYLVLDARALAESSEAWGLLKRALSGNEIVPLAPSPISGAPHVEFEPVPLKVKVVLVASPDTYRRLSERDPDLKSLFGVVARFEEDMARNPVNEDLVARRVAALIRDHGLAAFDASAVDRLIDAVSRATDTGDHISLDVSDLAGIVREADYWARERGAEIVSRADVDTAVGERAARRPARDGGTP